MFNRRGPWVTHNREIDGSNFCTTQQNKTARASQPILKIVGHLIYRVCICNIFDLFKFIEMTRII